MALTGFYAFASASQMVVDAARLLCAADRSRTRSNVVKSWEEMDIAGQFISTTILSDIDAADFLLADISTLNFNVVYEVGYAIGRSKRVILVKHRAVSASQPTIQEVGIFDTIGYKEYANSEELIRIVGGLSDVKPIHVSGKTNEKTPVYLVQPKIKTDYDGFLVSSIKKSYLFFRSFDPSESPRLAGPDAVDNVAESLAVVLHFLPKEHVDSPVHNIRSAFVAGLADGMEKRVLFIQTGDTPIPIDLRDFVVTCRTEKDFQKAAARLAEQLYEDRSQAALPLASPGSLLEELDLGASAAENEIASLGEYYMEIDAYRRAQRKEVRLVTGRKGSGKTAIFFTLRDRVRAQKRNVVLDLKPEGYQLMKLKDTVVNLLSAGTMEHTVTAFWEYLLWLELCYKLIEKDQELHKRNHLLFEPYQRLKAAYLTNEYSDEGDFSERLKKLIRDIAGVLEERYSNSPDRVDLSTAQITEVIYRHDFSKLKAQILDYLKHKEELWLLFDNLDKGWASQGVSTDDLVIVRALIEATRKLEREFARLDISAHTIIFLRNDVFEHLVDSTSDRGKETRANVDWDDQEQLRELVRRRVIRNLPEGVPVDFPSAWMQICTPIVENQDSAQYLIDRCLMRPRSLLDLIGHCRGYALNLGHARIEKDDILKGCSAFSNDLLAELDLEIRDVFPAATNVLYAFIGTSPTLSRERLIEILEAHGVIPSEQDAMIDLLLWFGFLGFVASDGSHKYIYSFHYNMKVLEGTHRVLQRNGVTYTINPAFAPSLGVR